MDTLRERCAHFHALHRSRTPLVLPNAWDAASARAVADAGAAAVATSSAAVARALGTADGERLAADLAFAAVARIVAAVDLPVTADIEGGYAVDPEGVGATVDRVLAAGAVGVNLEDTDHAAAALRPEAEQCHRIAAARCAAGRAGVPLFVNARVDTFLLGVADPVPATLDRAAAYVAAGADGVFVPGVTDVDTVALLADRTAAPLNVLATPGGPGAGAGAARISVGSALADAAYAFTRRAARDLLGTGSLAALGYPADARSVAGAARRSRGTTSAAAIPSNPNTAAAANPAR
ncbi:2-methylisocitrate lyase-like PEP mutase family enzyme [Prauserella shujinwangii]|uniref:2-methylisocitrate lyase-like PEP mutase family enzyme n=1 Tax=Prauserella shujinwangii TaxID=1453103 RepID=A0A2T0LW53_9PSEU|nr:isocitrate lyase/phosphoenolpyruvate mutase family protein [Prauserella shujinwangii]PRX48255.1 2-methylisocitrate lyase-like PEP mutase family enzyme [Prauserella shujinwangii]